MLRERTTGEAAEAGYSDTGAAGTKGLPAEANR